ncbi:MAG: hypothetical protein WBM24_03230 [Candidatus Sulfotelmatobacter sp.]
MAVSLITIENCLDSIARPSVPTHEIARIIGLIQEWRDQDPIPRLCPKCVDDENDRQKQHKPRKPGKPPAHEPGPVTVTFKAAV